MAYPLDQPGAPSLALERVEEFLNSQLAEKYEIATKWYKAPGDIRERQKFPYAWAGYDTITENDDRVNFIFSKPSLTNISESSVQLNIKVKSMDVGSIPYVDEEEADKTVSYRVPTIHSLVYKDKEGSDDKSIRLLWFDFDKAEVLSKNHLANDGEIESYLKHYLIALQNEEQVALFYPLDLSGSERTVHPPSPPITPTTARRANDATMGGFDMVVAMSQTFINAQIRWIFDHNHMIQRTKLDRENFKIQKVTVLLEDSQGPETNTSGTVHSPDSEDARETISHAIVMILVTPEAALLKKAQAVGRPQEAESLYRLAFTVNVNLGNASGTQSQAGNRDGDLQDIYLDLNSAKFSGDCTQWPQGLHITDEKKQRILESIRTDYFGRLRSCEMNILGRVPTVRGNATTGSSEHSLTSMKYRVFAPDPSTNSERILFVLGMVDSRTPPPISSFKPDSTSWLSGRDSQGILAVSRHMLRSLLVRGGAKIFTGSIFAPRMKMNGASALEAKLVQQYMMGQSVSQGEGDMWSWEPVNTPDGNEFKSHGHWRWTHKSKSQLSVSAGEGKLSDLATEDSAVVCDADYRVEMPIETSVSSDGPMEIKISGDVKVEISSKHSPQDIWKSKVSINWNIVVSTPSGSAAGGLAFEIKRLERPKVTLHGATGSWPKDVRIPKIHGTLNDQLLRDEDVNGVLEELLKLEDSCPYYFSPSTTSQLTLSTPMLNSEGAFFFNILATRS